MEGISAIFIKNHLACHFGLPPLSNFNLSSDNRACHLYTYNSTYDVPHLSSAITNDCYCPTNWLQINKPYCSNCVYGYSPKPLSLPLPTNSNTVAKIVRYLYSATVFESQLLSSVLLTFHHCLSPSG